MVGLFVGRLDALPVNIELVIKPQHLFRVVVLRKRRVNRGKQQVAAAGSHVADAGGDLLVGQVVLEDVGQLSTLEPI